MAMSTEFILTPWPTSPLWPFFRLLKRRVPTCPEPSLVQLAILSCITAIATGVVQAVLPLPLAPLPWSVGPPDAGIGRNGEAPAASLLKQLVFRTLINFKRIALFFMVMRVLHWTTRRIYWLRLSELLMQQMRSTASEAKNTLVEGVSGHEEENNQLLRTNTSDHRESKQQELQERSSDMNPLNADIPRPTNADADLQQIGTHGSPRRQRKFSALNEKRSINTLVVLGSGGHTAEMLRLIADFDLHRFHCIFVVGDSDNISEAKACDLLKAHKSLQGHLVTDLVQFVSIARCREVGQPLSRVPLRALQAFLSSLNLVFNTKPRLILMNGPGTCIPVVIAALVYEFIMAAPLRVIYTESFCRVSSLSLSGSFLYPLADRFLVQWRPLAEKLRFADYTGILF